ncbi:MAG: glycosyltransferase [Candidatus Aminicenantes bacterium]|nr:MAG: glycosyltransferase [Candidatus Aminicenantes bacterium]
MISIIIPTYNRAHSLREAIQSILTQDYFTARDSSDSYELLIIDDGSTDNTKEIVESFEDSVKYCFQENKGISAARNRGLGLAKGEFIAFLDSDDLWKREKISIQMSFMKAFPKAKVCYTEEVWIRKGIFVNPKKKHKKYSGWIFDNVLPLCLLSLSATLFRREVFDEIGVFDEELPACEDYDFGIRLAQRYPIHLISKPLIIKRGGHPDQLSRKYWGMDRFRIRALEKALLMNLTQPQETLVKQEIVRKCEILVSGFKKRNKLAEAQKYSRIRDKYKLG